MKRFISIFLIMVLLLTGCSSKNTNTSEIAVTADSSVASNDTGKEVIDDNVTNTNSIEDENQSKIESFSGLDDPDLLRYMEDDVYTKLIDDLDSNEYFVENVTAIYLSKEYIEELQYNSQSNIYFGYTLSELDEVFQGKKYVFTLGDDNTTVVKEMEVIEETSYYEMLKNVAIGTGVILFCVTVSVVTAGSAPAVSLIFAASAKTATEFAISGALISGATAGIITGYQTGDLAAGLDAGLMSASEAFKWGAISGAVAGGASEAFALKGATANGLTMNEAATIQKETKWSKDFIKQFSSTDDYAVVVENAKKGGLSLVEVENIWKNSKYPVDVLKMIKSTEEGAIYIDQAGLTATTVNGQAALIREIDLAYESELGGEMVTNLERMRKGYAAIDPATGQAYDLHHIGQTIDSPLAILTKAEHTAGENYGILHDPNIANGQGVHSQMSKAAWDKQRKEFWTNLAELVKP